MAFILSIVMAIVVMIAVKEALSLTRISMFVQGAITMFAGTMTWSTMYWILHREQRDW